MTFSSTFQFLFNFKFLNLKETPSSKIFDIHSFGQFMIVYFYVSIGQRYTNLNSCVHYFSIKSCVHICHARDKNIETITIGFTGFKKLHECILNGLNSQLNDRMTSFPVNFRFYRMLKISFTKIFIAPKSPSKNSKCLMRIFGSNLVWNQY